MNRNNKIALAALLLTGDGLTVALARQETNPRPANGKRASRATHSEPPTPEADRRIRAWSKLQKEAGKAERRKDYPLAESLFREAAEVLFEPGLHGDLARLYDAQGREREAFAEYRLFLADREGYTSSAQDDPRLLARYGDLCLRFSTPEEAASAFAKAAMRVRRDPAVGEPDPQPRSREFAAIRAAAYTAAGMRWLGHGKKEEAMRELDRAVVADPGYWVPRFYRAREYGKQHRIVEAAREAAVAERLAPPARREWVSRMRAFGRIPDAGGRMVSPKASFQPDPDSIWKPERAASGKG